MPTSYDSRRKSRRYMARGRIYLGPLGKHWMKEVFLGYFETREEAWAEIHRWKVAREDKA